jgi:hypothetical protein
MTSYLFKFTLFVLFVVCILDVYRQNYKKYNENTVSITDNNQISKEENIYNQHNKVSYILKSPYIVDLTSNQQVLEFLNNSSITSLVVVYDESSPITKKIMGDFILTSAAVGINNRLQCVRINILRAPCFYKMDIPHIPYIFIQYLLNNKISRIVFNKKISLENVLNTIHTIHNKQVLKLVTL